MAKRKRHFLVGMTCLVAGCGDDDAEKTQFHGNLLYTLSQEMGTPELARFYFPHLDPLPDPEPTGEYAEPYILCGHVRIEGLSGHRGKRQPISVHLHKTDIGWRYSASIHPFLAYQQKAPSDMVHADGINQNPEYLKVYRENLFFGYRSTIPSQCEKDGFPKSSIETVSEYSYLKDGEIAYGRDPAQ